MELINNFSEVFLSVWSKGILGVDIFEILIGIGIYFLFDEKKPNNMYYI